MGEKTCTGQRRICPTEAERSPNSVSSCSLKQPGKNKNKTMDEPVHSQRQISRVHTAALTTKHSWGLITTQDVFERKEKDININAKIVIGCCCPDNQWLIWWLYSVSKAVVAIGGASQDAHPGIRHSCSQSIWLTAWWTDPGAAISLFYSQRTQTPNLKDRRKEPERPRWSAQLHHAPVQHVVLHPASPKSSKLTRANHHEALVTGGRSL